MEIRKAEPKDYDAYNRLVAEVDHLHTSQAPRYFRIPDPPRSFEFFSKNLDDPARAIFLAEENGALVGYIHLRELDVEDRPILVPIKIVQISDIVVSKTRHRQGIGTALMQKGREWSKGRGAAELQLSVWNFNEGALKMYESQGFITKYRTMALPLDS